jgi:cytochrome P450
VGLKRYAEKNITLSDGFTIPKGSVTAIAMENMWDEAIYSDALVFHGDRFLRQRLLPGQERDARSTTVGSDYLGFGLGRHACPGRFYAASMMKLVLCHILLKYDIASVNDALFMEELEIRPREEELVL